MQSQSIKNGEVQVEYTDKAVSGWGGLVLFFEFARVIGFEDLLREAIPGSKSSNNRVDNLDVVVTFIAGVLTGARRYAHMQRVCGDEVIREVSGVHRLAAEDTVRRFFHGLERSESEDMYTKLLAFTNKLLVDAEKEDVLDLDSTLFERFGEQEGVAKGYHTARCGQRSHHPLLAIFTKARHIPLVWLREGGASTLRGADAFVDELMARLPDDFRVSAVRADSGFYSQDYLQAFERHALPYIIPVRMHGPVKRFVAAIKEASWVRLDDRHEIADTRYKSHGWGHDRRVIGVRRRITSSKPDQLFSVIGYEYNAFVTTLELPAIECCNFYNDRGNCENVIKEFKNDFGASGFAVHSFNATETAVRLISVLYNLMAEFKRRIVHDHRPTLNTLRHSLFVVGAILGRSARKVVLRLGLRSAQAAFSTLLERVASITYDTAPQFDPVT